MLSLNFCFYFYYIVTVSRKLRKKKRNDTAPEITPPVSVDLDAIRQSVSSSIPPAVVTRVLLAEVINVKHDPYRMSEEVKVNLRILLKKEGKF